MCRYPKENEENDKRIVAVDVVVMAIIVVGSGVVIVVVVIVVAVWISIISNDDTLQEEDVSSWVCVPRHFEFSLILHSKVIEGRKVGLACVLPVNGGEEALNAAVTRTIKAV